MGEGRRPQPLLAVEPDDPWHEHSASARSWVIRDVDHLLDRLALAGTLVRAEPQNADRIDGGGATVRLTGLGTLIGRADLLTHGYDGPLVGELAQADAVTLLDAVADYAPEAAQAEIQAWCHARGSQAVPELAAALHAEPDPGSRAVAAGALSMLPIEAEAGMRTLCDDALLRPYANIWLVDRGLEPPASLDPSDGPKVMLETLAGILAFSGTEVMVQTYCETAPDRNAGVETIASLGKADSPHAGTVLQALTEAGDREVAKAARRALFKRRSRSRA